MADQRINHSFNNSKFGDNVNIQGDHVNQINDGISTATFVDLIAEINEKILDPNKKDQALFYAEELQKAIRDKDNVKTRKIFGWIREILHDSSALITIGTALGFL